MERVRLGFAAVTRKTPAFPPQEQWANRTHKEALTVLKGMSEKWDFDLFALDTTISEPDEVKKVAKEFREKGADVILLQTTSFASGELASEFASYLKSESVPLVLWGVPETAEGRCGRLSLTGQNFYASIFHARVIPYKWIFGKSNDKEHFQNQLCNTLLAVKVIKHLREVKVAIIGSAGVAGRYESSFDETMLKDTFGITVHRIDLSTIFKLMEKAPEKDLKAIVDDIGARAEIHELSEEDLEKSAKIYWALREIARENDYSAIALRCWPEFRELYGTNPCASVAMLNDDGIITSDEADVLGLTSMLASHYATEGEAVPTLLDLVGFNEERNSVSLWHCGASALRLKRSGSRPRACRHFENPFGVIIDESLETGPVTLVRFIGARGQRMLVVEGNVIDTPADAPSGSWGEVQLSGDVHVKDLINTILTSGCPHHYSLARTHHAEILKEVAYWLKIKEVRTIPYERGAGAFASWNNEL